MIIIVYGKIHSNGDIQSGDIFYRKCYDPKALLNKYADQDDLIVTLKIFVTKGGKLVALVDNITTV